MAIAALEHRSKEGGLDASLGGYFGSMLLKGGADVTFWSGPNARPYFNATAWS